MFVESSGINKTSDSSSVISGLIRPWRLERLLLSVSSIALVQAMLFSPAAAQHVWTGNVDSNWFTAGNWTPASVPAGTVHIELAGSTPLHPFIDGAAANLAGSVSVGTNGLLTIQNGGSLTLAVANDSLFIGGGAVGAVGAGATVTVTGTGSSLVGTGGSVFVGTATGAPTVGPGTFNVLNGAHVSGFRIDVALDPNTNGHALVSGAGSNIMVPGGIVNPWVSVGFNGTGTLEIRDGATVSGPIGQIATNLSGHGTVTVDGAGSRWDITGGVNFHVGGAGTGVLNILNGGTVQTGTSAIGIGDTGGTGTVMVDGAGSTLTNTADINVGNVGDGTLTLLNGGNVTTTGTLWIARGLSNGTLNIGAAPGNPAAAPGTVSAAGVQFGIGDGVINFNHTGTDYVFAPAISGPGAVNQIAGTTVLTATDTYTGPTTISGGTLRVNGSITSPTTVNAGGTLGGTGTIFNDVTNAGIVAPGPGPGGFGALTMTGSYVGNGGTLAIKTALGGDGSPTDQLILQGAGASASGSTAVQVTNVGGAGGQTTIGIPIVVTRNGATTTANAFQLAGPVAAGAYQYQLFQGPPSGGTADQQNTWYLRNNIPNPNNPSGPPIPLHRPEAPIYSTVAATARSLNMASIGTFHERNGDQGLVRGNGTSDRVWGRLYGQSTEQGHTGTLSGRFDGHAGGVQSGIDVYRVASPSGYESRLGFFGGYAQSRADVSGFALGRQDAFAGNLQLEAFSVGGYWTQTGAPGWYIDAVLQGSRFDGDGKSTNQVGVRTDGYGLAASLEAGYPIPLGAGIRIEPQAQLVYQHLAFDDTHDGFSHVAHDTGHGFAGRLGLRLAADTVYGGTRVSPYLKASVWQDWTGTDRVVFAGVDVIEARHRGTSLEVGGGIVAQLANNVGLWAAADYTTDVAGEADRRTLRGNAGVRVTW